MSWNKIPISPWIGVPEQLHLYMKMNSDKFHLPVADHKFEQIWTKIGTDLIW